VYAEKTRAFAFKGNIKNSFCVPVALARNIKAFDSRKVSFGVFFIY
jgi:hypothetical protein